MYETVDVAIVGAGPYGLSVGAHLRKSGVRVRQFGSTMSLWRDAMPQGMFLKSQGFASNISDPDGTHTLAAFCRATGRPYADYGLPVPLDAFIAYGQWFAGELVPGVEDTRVTRVASTGGSFQLTLATGERVTASRVVMAAGVEHFAYVPPRLAALPASACTHSSAHTDLSPLRGQRVIVVGAGQSALETAALLHEQGTDVQLVMRRQQPAWNGEPLALDRPLYHRLAEPEAGLGSGWGNWLYSKHPGLFRHLPASTRVYRARTALGPAGACWLRPRVEGTISMLTGHSVVSAEAAGGGVRLGLAGPDGPPQELSADHVIAATGYRADVRRLAFLDETLRGRLRTLAGTPTVDRNYQSSVPGLYVTGPAVAPTMGPVMRFVYGAGHAARTVAPQLAATATHASRVPVGAGR
jgi:FAD-dependent urate hydroxylase